MSETKPNEMKPMKMVRRSVALALGIICIVLIAGLGSAMVYYTITVNDLTDIANLNKSTLWVNDTTVTQPASNYTSWFFVPKYAGYVSVHVLSTTSNTYVRLIYPSYGLNYDSQISVSTYEVSDFPVLPTPYLEIRVGNTNSVGNATETVTITYYY